MHQQYLRTAWLVFAHHVSATDNAKLALGSPRDKEHLGFEQPVEIDQNSVGTQKFDQTDPYKLKSASEIVHYAGLNIGSPRSQITSVTEDSFNRIQNLDGKDSIPAYFVFAEKLDENGQKQPDFSKPSIGDPAERRSASPGFCALPFKKQILALYYEIRHLLEGLRTDWLQAKEKSPSSEKKDKDLYLRRFIYEHEGTFEQIRQCIAVAGRDECNLSFLPTTAEDLISALHDRNGTAVDFDQHITGLLAKLSESQLSKSNRMSLWIAQLLRNEHCGDIKWQYYPTDSLERMNKTSLLSVAIPCAFTGTSRAHYAYSLATQPFPVDYCVSEPVCELLGAIQTSKIHKGYADASTLIFVNINGGLTSIGVVNQIAKNGSAIEDDPTKSPEHKKKVLEAFEAVQRDLADYQKYVDDCLEKIKRIQADIQKLESSEDKSSQSMIQDSINEISVIMDACTALYRQEVLKHMELCNVETYYTIPYTFSSSRVSDAVFHSAIHEQIRQRGEKIATDAASAAFIDWLVKHSVRARRLHGRLSTCIVKLVDAPSALLELSEIFDGEAMPMMYSQYKKAFPDAPAVDVKSLDFSSLSTDWEITRADVERVVSPFLSEFEAVISQAIKMHRGPLNKLAICPVGIATREVWITKSIQKKVREITGEDKDVSILLAGREPLLGAYGAAMFSSLTVSNRHPSLPSLAEFLLSVDRSLYDSVRELSNNYVQNELERVR